MLCRGEQGESERPDCQIIILKQCMSVISHKNSVTDCPKKKKKKYWLWCDESGFSRHQNARTDTAHRTGSSSRHLTGKGEAPKLNLTAPLQRAGHCSQSPEVIFSVCSPKPSEHFYSSFPHPLAWYLTALCCTMHAPKRRMIWLCSRVWVCNDVQSL